VEEEVYVRCHTEAMDPMDMVSKGPIIRLPVCTHFMVDHSMVLSLAQGVVGSRGVEAVAESSVAGEGFVVGGSKVQVAAWRPRRNQWGLDIQSP
jgi:hypothetical protein